MQDIVGLAPAIEASADGLQHFGQRGEVAVVSGKAPSQLPHPLYRGQLRAVGRQEQQAQLSSMAMKEVGHESCVMIASVVEHEEIAACRNMNFEFSALAGSYITNLQYLDSDWVHNNFRGIFPIAYPANCLSALDGLAFGTATEAIYKELVDTGIVVWALNQELNGGHARENLVQRMCLAYLWNNEELESPRFLVLFDSSHTDDLVIACRYFWAIRGQPLTDDHREKILLFWGRCVTWAANVEPAPAKLLSALSLLSCHLKSVGPRELAWLLAVALHIEVNHHADFFIEELGRLVEISPLEVGNVLATALQTHKPMFDYEDRLKILVTKLAERPETRPDALRCAESLRYIPGMVQLYAQLISDSTHGGPGSY